MTKRKYLAACMSQSVKWLESVAANPSPSMRPIHVALVRLALRYKAQGR
jgi:hypothetical protein